MDANMKLQDQVITVEQAKKLLELGVMKSQKCNNSTQLISLFVHVSENGKDWECVLTSGYNWSDYPCYSGYIYQVPAFTKTEIDELVNLAGNEMWEMGDWKANGIAKLNPTQRQCERLIYIIENYMYLPNDKPKSYIVDLINEHTKSWLTKQQTT